MAGKLLALSLCNGGSTGNCLSKAVYQYLVYGEENALVNPTVDDIPDYEVRTAITQVLYNYLYYQSINISFYTRPFNLH